MILVASLVVSAASTACFALSAAESSGQTLTLEQIETEAKFTRDFDKAMDRLQALIKREPKNARAYMIAGQMLEARGYGGLAEQMYRQADKCDPTGPQSNLQTFYLKLREEGATAAAQYLGYLAERFPDDAGVLLMQGMIARLHKNYADARLYYERASQVEPRTRGVYTGLASLEMINRDYPKALKLLNTELKYHPDDPAAKVAMGQVLLLTGRPAEAIPFLKEANAFGTSSPLIERRLVADLLMTACSSTGKNTDDALEYGMLVLASTPTDNAQAVRAIKRKLSPLLRRVPQEKVLNIEAVVENQCGPNREYLATLRFGLADILDRANMDLAAQQMFRKGLELMPAAARGNFRLGAQLVKHRDYANGYLYTQQAFMEDRGDKAIVNSYVRMNSRLNNRKRDIAWRLKDFFKGGCVTEFCTDDTLLINSL